MPARLCVHLPDDAARVRVLSEGASYTLGRDADCEIVVDHPSVSRRHAALIHNALGWQLKDLGSKNGLRVGGERVDSRPLRGGQWFSIGDVFCQFDLIGAEQVQVLAARSEQRRQTSKAWTDRLHQAPTLDALLAEIISAMVELAECQRGFLLAGNPVDGLRVRACFRMEPSDLSERDFGYSTGAVERALRDRRPVFLSNPTDQAWLRGRASVLAQSLRVMACLPLIVDGLLLGCAYVDSDEDGKLLSELDAEILAAFADQAAMTLAAADLQTALSRIESWVAVDGDERHDGGAPAPQWAALRAVAEVP